jgi:hypothetical protein
MSGKIAEDPGVNRLQTDTDNAGHFWEDPPLGDQQDRWYSLQRAVVAHVLQRLLEPALVVPIETKFGRTLCSAHTASLPPLRYFSKNFC